tara:strand:- start:2104 stop:2382 length:279 start_codon:yes stop_codon:yes gene_type:complete
MSSIINLSINLDKIDKSKIVAGKKGKYLNLTVGGNRDGEDQYGNTHYVFQSQSKEEREAKSEKNYLGNGKEFVFDSQPAAATSSNDEDDLPF